MVYTLKLFNTGQVTLPKSWREKFDTHHFVAEERDDGLLIKPLESKTKDIVFYKTKEGFGLYGESGLPVDEIVRKIEKIHGSN